MGMSPSRKRKLEMLTRSLARGDFPRAGDILASKSAEQGQDPLRPLTLEEACGGREHRLTTPLGEGVFWRLERELTAIDPEGGQIERQYEGVLKGARHRFDELEASAELCHVADATCEDLLFMDLETCGFSGCPIFLVGVMHWRDGHLVFDQFLARDYSEEGAILQAYAARYNEAGVLVTFNGKAFDMNMIRERSAFHAVELPPRDPPHLDLLHESRRRWKRDLPNCKLQTLERCLCGRVRTGDIPGAMIPDAYHKFVEDCNARQMADILHHNVLDLLTMAQIVAALLTGAGAIEA
jgi:uncharacterized protein YprB with RNaseH-like and TPR domain